MRVRKRRRRETEGDVSVVGAVSESVLSHLKRRDFGDSPLMKFECTII